MGDVIHRRGCDALLRQNGKPARRERQITWMRSDGGDGGGVEGLYSGGRQ